MPNPSALNFTNVEALRVHMLLTTAQMAKLLGVSRVTYSGWVKGKSIRKGNDTNVRVVLKKMFIIITDHKWPQPAIIAMPSIQRFKTLLEMLDKAE